MEYDEMREKLKDMIAQKGAARGRPLTDRERLANLKAALCEHDTDCAHHLQGKCDCGADEFQFVDFTNPIWR